jgi:hypothetical protein
MGRETERPMTSDTSLDKFIKLYEQKYGIKLDRDKALDIFIRLISVVKINVNKDNFEILKKNRKSKLENLKKNANSSLGL